jgi:hypothetical protein
MRTITINIEIPDEYSEETHQQMKLIAEYAREALTIFAAKQEAYGRGNIAKFGLTGVTIRLHDKLERLINLTHNNAHNNVNDESVADTLLDVSNYGLIGRAVSEGRW